MRFAASLVLALAASACVEPPVDEDAPQDAIDDGTTGGGKADAATCSLARCGDPDAATILFPGNPTCAGGCERTLAGAGVYIPPRNGQPWGETYLLGSPDPAVIAGYSSGRIALLRRLALVGDGRHAILLDPSWPDGARDFLGRGPELGEDLVRAWLAADPSRTFLLIYSRRSIGWSTYAALQHSDVGAQVKVCSVPEPHLRIPAVPRLHDALVDPDAWDNGTCTWGG